ncbi:DinB family protein [Lysinibacillus yapensis]|uniref:DinB family protein n=1 Tax=Ureibacillus yapensis TaxID=2304605 RepID=A0A396S3B4_9BACL|nr:DinB family protein [Lysinibacillus yapensis]RHW32723.1 DinB family protein [Lysinibacillus yapensis]
MENNRKIREEIWESVGRLSDIQLNDKLFEESWSIAQILEHLFLMEENAIHQISAALNSGTQFGKPSSFPLHLIADRKKKVNAPKDLIPTNEYQTLAKLKEKLDASRAALEKLAQFSSEEELNEKTLIHPRFGILTLKQWINLVGYHEERHLGQIREVKEALKINI